MVQGMCILKKSMLLPGYFRWCCPIRKKNSTKTVIRKNPFFCWEFFTSGDLGFGAIDFVIIDKGRVPIATCGQVTPEEGQNRGSFTPWDFGLPVYCDHDELQPLSSGSRQDQSDHLTHLKHGYSIPQDLDSGYLDYGGMVLGNRIVICRIVGPSQPSAW